MTKKLFYFLAILTFGLAALLRLYRIDQLPPSLYWEEVALGYDAYSILETGRDHHGNAWPLLAFESFGDWKPSGYFYLLVPFVKIFGLTSLGVRLPTALAGIFVVLGSGILVRQLFSDLDSAKLRRLQLWVYFSAAVSSWGLIFSRSAWEVMVATCLLLWGVIAFREFMAKQKLVLGGTGVILLILSMYTYHATRIIAPLFGLGLVIEWYIDASQKRFDLQNFQKFATRHFRTLAIFIGMSLVLVGPLLLSITDPQIGQRFQETSRFASGDAVTLTNQLRQLEPSFLGRLIFHRYWYGIKEVGQGFLDHFSWNFLFLTGDNNPRHSTGYFGIFYPFDLIWLSVAGYWLIKNWRGKYWWLVFWLAIGILPASLSTATPHALRILPTFPIWMLLIGLGLFMSSEFLFKIVNRKWMVVLTLLLIGLTQLGLFWRHYTQVYLDQHYDEWQYGYSELVEVLSEYRLDHPQTPIYVSRAYGRPAMYYFFYSRQDPRQVQAQARIVDKDKSEFLEYQQLRFINQISEIDAHGFVALTPDEYQRLTQRSWQDLSSDQLVKWPTAAKPVWVITEFSKGQLNE